MHKYITFVRTNKHNLDYAIEQEKLINQYIDENHISKDDIRNVEVEINTASEEKNIGILFNSLRKRSILIAASLDTFGRQTEFIVQCINFLLSQDIRIVIVKYNFLLGFDQETTKISLETMSMMLDLTKGLDDLTKKESELIKKKITQKITQEHINAQKILDSYDKIKQKNGIESVAIDTDIEKILEQVPIKNKQNSIIGDLNDIEYVEVEYSDLNKSKEGVKEIIQDVKVSHGITELDKSPEVIEKAINTIKKDTQKQKTKKVVKEYKIETTNFIELDRDSLPKIEVPELLEDIQEKPKSNDNISEADTKADTKLPQVSIDSKEVIINKALHQEENSKLIE